MFASNNGNYKSQLLKLNHLGKLRLEVASFKYSFGLAND